METARDVLGHISTLLPKHVAIQKEIGVEGKILEETFLYGFSLILEFSYVKDGLGPGQLFLIHTRFTSLYSVTPLAKRLIRPNCGKWN